MEGKRKQIAGIALYLLVAVIITVGYGWFVVATSGRDDLPRALRYFVAVSFVTFGGIAGTGAYLRIQKWKKEKRKH